MIEMQNVKLQGNLKAPSKAMVMIHGRGANADDILSLSEYFNVDDILYAAPQSENNSWYPYSFLNPVEDNEPYLSKALDLIDSIFAELNEKGISNENIFILGFSQGACLGLEYAARKAQRFFGIAALSGGLIGREINTKNYKSNFFETPIFIGCSDDDPHIPMYRLRETEKILKALKANVNLKIYEGIGHTVIQEEIDIINHILSTNRFS